MLSMIKQPPNLDQIVSGKRSLSFALTLEILGEALAHKIYKKHYWTCMKSLSHFLALLEKLMKSFSFVSRLWNWVWAMGQNLKIIIIIGLFKHDFTWLMKTYLSLCIGLWKNWII